MKTGNVASGSTPNRVRIRVGQKILLYFYTTKEGAHLSINRNTITNTDCFVGMEQLQEHSIDMILCDLPYGMTQNKWDIALPLDKLWESFGRIIKHNGAIVLTAQTPFDKVLGCSNLKNLRYEWIWNKKMATGHLNVKGRPLKLHENILVFYQQQPTYNPQFTIGKPYNRGNTVAKSTNYGSQRSRVSNNESGRRYPLSILEVSNANRQGGFHPTQKPVALFEYLIRTYTNEGELVLDCTAGSCTTAIACINSGRDYICFELDEGYYNKAVERVAGHENT